MGGDEAIGFRQQRMIVRQWFRVRHIQPGGSEATGTQRRQQGVLVNGRAAPDIVKNRPGFSPAKRAASKKWRDSKLSGRMLTM